MTSLATGPVDVLDSALLRSAFGRFATGVTVVTCLDGQGQPLGLTVNSFNSLSMDPPLMLWSLRLKSQSLGAFTQAQHFAVNVLAASQQDLSQTFASALSVTEKFRHGHWVPGQAGVPVLVGACAVLECTLRSHQDEGDHRLFIGQVRRISESSVPPLAYQGGRYWHLDAHGSSA